MMHLPEQLNGSITYFLALQIFVLLTWNYANTSHSSLSPK